MRPRFAAPEAHERVREILNAADLGFGFAICLPGEPRIMIEGGGDEASLTLPVARLLLDALRLEWGAEDADVRRLQSLIHALESGE